ncbi:uncharacterized protein [Gossypium hirsutum]|uniref:Uncharacterized protein isoform X4 n=1 Tax=Gossypium hirsutum TaxID=3635 RepID=A0ABM3AI77_GOSHI|nr:uncharacterized protein LOC107929383 isoform X4 [Gossypium hirsutum]
MKGREKWCFTSKPGQKLAITIWLHRRYLVDPRLSDTFPALGLYYAVNKSYNDAISKPSTSPPSVVSDCDSIPSPIGSPHAIVGPGDNPRTVKTRLRQWAQVRTVRVEKRINETDNYSKTGLFQKDGTEGINLRICAANTIYCSSNKQGFVFAKFANTLRIHLLLLHKYIKVIFSDCRETSASQPRVHEDWITRNVADVVCMFARQVDELIQSLSLAKEKCCQPAKIRYGEVAGRNQGPTGRT